MELILSEYLDSLEDELFAAVKKAIESKRHTLVIVPAQATQLMEQQITERCGVKGIMTIEVISFERLSEHLFEQTGGRAAERMSSVGAAMLVRRAMDECGDGLKIVSGQDATVHEAAARFILSLKAEDILPEKLTEVAEKKGGVLGAKLSDIAKIYSRMLEYSKNGIMDSQDAEEYARSLITASDYTRGADVIIYGFDVLPASRVRTVCELMRAGEGMTVLLEANEENDIFSRQQRTVFALEGACRAAGRPFEKRTVSGRRSLSPVTRHIEDCFYKYPTETFDGEQDALIIVHARDRCDEVTAAAGTILRAVSGGDVSLSQIGLIAGSPDGYLRHITDVFSRYDIPFFYDGKRRLSTHRLYSFTTAAVRLCCGDWSTRNVYGYLKSGLLPIADDETDALIRFAEEHGIRGGSFARAFRDAPGDTENIRARAFDGIAALEKASAKRDAAELARLLREHIAALGVKGQLDEDVKELTALDRSKEARFVSQVFDRMDDILSQCALLMGGLKKKELAGVLETAAESVNIAVVPPSSDEVAIGDVTHSIFPHKKLILILGANDGMLPARAEGGLFSEYEAERISEDMLFPGHTAIEDQRFFLRRALTSAECTVISYNDADGLPSMTVDRITKLFSGIKMREAETVPGLEASLAELARQLRAACDGEREDAPAVAEYLADEQGRRLLSRMIAVTLNDNAAVRLPRETARRLYDGRTMSVSRIEQYYSCPYKYFIGCGLAPKDTEPFEENALHSGSFVHSLLENASKRATANGVFDATDEELRRIVDETANEQRNTHNNGIFVKNARYSVTEEYLRDEAFEALKAVRGQLHGVSMMGAEKEFGSSEELTLETPAGTVRLRGRIDRIDAADTEDGVMARVIDYKTGKKSFKIKDVYDGISLQLGVYLAALVKEGMRPAGGFYMTLELPLLEPGKNRTEATFKLSGFVSEDAGPLFSGSRKSALTPADMDALLEKVRELVGRAFAEIGDGINDICPIDENACTICDYGSICRFDRRFSGNTVRAESAAEEEC